MRMTTLAMTLLLGMFWVSKPVLAQTVESYMAEGKKMEQRYKDAEALEQYKMATRIGPKLVEPITKCAEVQLHLALAEADPATRLSGLEQAAKFGEVALRNDSNHAAAQVVVAAIAGEKSLLLKSKEDAANALKTMRYHAEKATQLAPDDARGWHILGKWHLTVLTMPAVKKNTIQVVYGGTKQANIKEAISFLEKSKAKDAYYCPAFYDLARAYEFDKQYQPAIDVLQQLQKLPGRRQYDKNLKASGAALLQSLQ